MQFYGTTSYGCKRSLFMVSFLIDVKSKSWSNTFCPSKQFLLLQKVPPPPYYEVLSSFVQFVELLQDTLKTCLLMRKWLILKSFTGTQKHMYSEKQIQQSDFDSPLICSVQTEFYLIFQFQIFLNITSFQELTKKKPITFQIWYLLFHFCKH